MISEERGVRSEVGARGAARIWRLAFDLFSPFTPFQLKLKNRRSFSEGSLLLESNKLWWHFVGVHFGLKILQIRRHSFFLACFDLLT